MQDNQESLTLKQITIVRCITMAGGFILSIVILAYSHFFDFGPGYELRFSNALVALIGLACLVNLIRRLLQLRQLLKG